MPLHTFGDLLGKAEALKALTARVRRLEQLQSLYVRTAPRELAGSSRVKGCRAGTLFVWADNAAVAAKLKQLAPRLVAAIRENEPEITQIRIEVQVGGRGAAGPYKSRKTPLTPATIERFGTLAKSIPEGSLKNALARMAARHGGRLDEHQPLEHVKHHRDDRHHESELDGAPRPREEAPVAGVKVQTDAKRHAEQDENTDET
jgi:hypothetical protein